MRDPAIRLGELRELKPGWYDETTPAIDERALMAAEKFATTEEAAGGHIYPTLEGGIQFEWDDREVEFHPDGTREDWKDGDE
jgi:hypothetical protein